VSAEIQSFANLVRVGDMSLDYDRDVEPSYE
jgi:hypothetical protein